MALKLKLLKDVCESKAPLMSSPKGDGKERMSTRAQMDVPSYQHTCTKNTQS